MTKKISKSKRTKKTLTPLIIFAALLLLFLLFFILSRCSQSLSEKGYPTQSYLTPASMEAVIGDPVSVIPVANDWRTYDDTQIGIHIQYPPDWTAANLVDTLGVGFYPPGSEPDLPTPAITFRFLNQSYTSGKPFFNTGSAVTPFYIAGIAGQQYQDAKFSIPNQSSYVELPYGDGLLLIESTLGPTVNLTPQLLEMLKTLNLSSPLISASSPPESGVPAATEAPVAINCYYALRSGDHLAGVAEKFGIGGDNFSNIVNFDGTPIIDVNGIYVGQVVIIPNISQDLCIQEGGTILSGAATEVPLAEIIDAKGVPMALVPASEFTMGSDKGNSDEMPIHQVYLDAYYMDKYEVTNARYKACVETGACLPPQDTSRTTEISNSKYYDKLQFDNYPVIFVDWDQAKTYCEWRGGGLPTEAQWEKAARGTDGRTYPWGEGLDCSRANYDVYGICRGISGTTEVGSYANGVSPYGIYDLIGNVSEMVADWYSATYYQNSPSSNPLGPSSGQSRVLRGGSWLYNVDRYLRASSRYYFHPDYNYYEYGFRCARTP